MRSRSLQGTGAGGDGGRAAGGSASHAGTNGRVLAGGGSADGRWRSRQRAAGVRGHELRGLPLQVKFTLPPEQLPSQRVR
jgi:hypothetical protein